MNDALLAAASDTFSRVFTTVHEEHASAGGLTALKAVSEELKQSRRFVLAVVHLDRWFKEHPERREDLIRPAGILDCLLFKPQHTPLTPLPPGVCFEIKFRRTRFATPVFDFAPMVAVVRPFLRGVVGPSDESRESWQRSREAAAMNLFESIADEVQNFQGGSRLHLTASRLVRLLVRADFRLASYTCLASDFESMQTDGSVEWQQGRGSTGSDHSGKKDGDAASPPERHSGDPEAMGGLEKQKQETESALPIPQLEAECARTWERLGVFGEGSSDLRTALLEAAVTLAHAALSKAGETAEGQEGIDKLAALEEAFNQQLFDIDLFSLVGQVLQERPELLQHVAPDSDLLLFVDRNEMRRSSRQSSVQRGADGDGSDRAGAGLEQLNQGSSTAFGEAFQALLNASGASGENFEASIKDLSTTLLPSLESAAIEMRSKLLLVSVNAHTVESLFVSVSRLRFLTKYIFFLEKQGFLDRLQDQKKAGCIREQTRAEREVSQSLIMLSNSPHAASDMKRMLDDLVGSGIQRNMDAFLEAVSPGDRREPRPLRESFLRLRPLFSRFVNIQAMQVWLQAHPDVIENLPRTGVLFFQVPLLNPLQEGKGPVVPGTRSVSPRGFLLFGLANYSRHFHLIEPYCREGDLPPDDIASQTEWVQTVTSTLNMAYGRLKADYSIYLVYPKAHAEPMLRCLISTETSLIRFSFLARQTPALLEAGSPFHRLMEYHSRVVALCWETLGFYGPMAEDTRDMLLRHVLQPDDARIQASLRANAEGSFSERLRQQRIAIIKRLQHMQLLTLLSEWMQANPSVLQNPYLATDSVLLAAILDASPERRQGTHQGAVGSGFDTDDSDTEASRPVEAKARRHGRSRLWRPSAPRHGSGASSSTPRRAARPSKSSQPPSLGPQRHSRARGSDSATETAGAPPEGERGSAEGKGRTETPAQTAADASESEQEAVELGRQEPTDRSDGDKAGGVDEQQEETPSPLRQEEVDAALALMLLSLPKDRPVEERSSIPLQDVGGMQSEGTPMDGSREEQARDSTRSTSGISAYDAHVPEAEHEDVDLLGWDQPLDLSMRRRRSRGDGEEGPMDLGR
ncbi:hypothetical protein TGRUB_213480 [Toxoplasma gondii RUB]|uniref:Uncharacterized protein n=1 Tax=Toxoplasma gondii RUB TaxID=935652 RepID=A0A086M2K4_TOXGO|nr:hypothetical protein TGRUB_213480 [Toxoplasma gondii RUB]